MVTSSFRTRADTNRPSIMAVKANSATARVISIKRWQQHPFAARAC